MKKFLHNFFFLFNSDFDYYLVDIFNQVNYYFYFLRCL